MRMPHMPPPAHAGPWQPWQSSLAQPTRVRRTRAAPCPSGCRVGAQMQPSCLQLALYVAAALHSSEAPSVAAPRSEASHCTPSDLACMSHAIMHASCHVRWQGLRVLVVWSALMQCRVQGPKEHVAAHTGTSQVEAASTLGVFARSSPTFLQGVHTLSTDSVRSSWLPSRTLLHPQKQGLVFRSVMCMIRGAPGRADGRSAVAGLRGGELAGAERLRSFLSGAAGPGGSGAGAPAGVHPTHSAAHAGEDTQGAALGASGASSAAPIRVRFAPQAGTWGLHPRF